MKNSVLLFATNNHHKADEIRQVLGDGFEIKTLKDAGILIDIPEPHATLEENAREKSTFLKNLTGMDCFSEDTGLEVFSLNGEPGVKSARYAGEEANTANNIEKLLTCLKGIDDRAAQFRTVISFVSGEKEYQFEGICKGHIAKAEKGTEGFGYDPVFIPEGADKTFAEMSMAEKANFSHRKKATQQFISFLTKNEWPE